MKKCFYAWLLSMSITAATAVTTSVVIKSHGEIAAENFVRRLPALWAHGTEDELFNITTNAVDAILSNKDAERRDLAFTYCADAVAALEVESRNDEDYDRSLDMRLYLIQMMLRHSGKTDAGILRGFDCRVKFYGTLKRESVKFPVIELPSFVEDLKAAMASKYNITNNIRYAGKGEFTPEGIRGWKEAQATSGGVSTDEIWPETSESKLVRGLFITGELADRDFPCGGFNLSNAWITGLAAARSIAAGAELQK